MCGVFNTGVQIADAHGSRYTGQGEHRDRAQEMCESRGGRPGLLSLISLRLLWT